jgi:hypothetical protein
MENTLLAWCGEFPDRKGLVMGQLYVLGYRIHGWNFAFAHLNIAINVKIVSPSAKPSLTNNNEQPALL